MAETTLAHASDLTTTDGVYTLTQNIFFKYGSRLVLVGNLVKNNDTVAHTVVFDRYGDLDVNGSAPTNTFDAAGGSVLAKQTDGVLLTSLGNPSLVSAKGAETFGNWFASGAANCSHTFETLPHTADDVAIIEHTATIAPGASVIFRVGYRLM